jgi:hypothetical protein
MVLERTVEEKAKAAAVAKAWTRLAGQAWDWRKDFQRSDKAHPFSD